MDEAAIQELASYTKTTDEHKLEQYGAPPGLYDDTVVAAQRAQQMRVMAPGGGVLVTLAASVGQDDVSYAPSTHGWN